MPLLTESYFLLFISLASHASPATGDSEIQDPLLSSLLILGFPFQQLNFISSLPPPQWVTPKLFNLGMLGGAGICTQAL